MTYISKCYWSPSSCSSVFVSIIFLLLSIFRRSSQWASFYIQKNAKNNYTIFWHGKSENDNTSFQNSYKFCHFECLKSPNICMQLQLFWFKNGPLWRSGGGGMSLYGKGVIIIDLFCVNSSTPVLEIEGDKLSLVYGSSI